jgi:hypothetical protein
VSSRKRLAAILTSALLAVLAVPLTAGPAHADYYGNCPNAQPSHVWVGGLDNNGSISSDSPGGTIYVPLNHGVYLTGVVESFSSITFTFTHSNGFGDQSITTNIADQDCVVHNDQNLAYVFVWQETQQWSATYTEVETHNRVTKFLGTIVVQ